MTSLVQTIAQGVAGVLLAATLRAVARRPNRLRTLRIVRGVRFWHVALALLFLGGVLPIALLLLRVPWLAWGWLDFNLVFSVPADTAMPWGVRVAALLALVAILPLQAWREERTFRLGAPAWSWSKRCRKTVAFGALHVLMGIPLAGVVVVTLCGFGYLVVDLIVHGRLARALPPMAIQTCLQRRRALRARVRLYDLAALEACRVHLVFNLLCVAVCAFELWKGAVLR
jgi:hypothetical protein